MRSLRVAAVAIVVAAAVIAPSRVLAQPSVPAPPIMQTTDQARLLDTRPGGTTVDGLGARGGRLNPTVGRQVVIAGRAGVRADADAVSLTVTALGASSSGSVYVWPCGRPEQRQTVVFHGIQAATAGTAIVPLGAAKLCIGSTTWVHVLVDLQAQFVDGSGYQPTSVRLVHTQGGLGTTRLRAGAWVHVATPAPAQPSFLRVTARQATAAGTVQVRSCSSAAPTLEPPSRPALAFPARSTATTLTTVWSVAGLCLLATADVDVTIDLVGSLPPIAIDELGEGVEQSWWIGEPGWEAQVDLAAGVEYRLDRLQRNAFLAGWLDVALLQFVASDASGPGHLAAYRCDRPQPGTSVLNTSGRSVSTTAFVELGDDGSLCLRANVAMTVDVSVHGGADARGGPLEVVVPLTCGDAIAPAPAGFPVWVAATAPITAGGWISGGVAPYSVSAAVPGGWTATPSTDVAPAGRSSFLLELAHPALSVGEVQVPVTISDAAGVSVSFVLTIGVTPYKPIPVTC